MSASAERGRGAPEAHAPEGGRGKLSRRRPDLCTQDMPFYREVGAGRTLKRQRRLRAGRTTFCIGGAEALVSTETRRSKAWRRATRRARTSRRRRRRDPPARATSLIPITPATTSVPRSTARPTRPAEISDAVPSLDDIRRRYTTTRARPAPTDSRSIRSQATPRGSRRDLGGQSSRGRRGRGSDTRCSSSRSGRPPRGLPRRRKPERRRGRSRRRGDRALSMTRSTRSGSRSIGALIGLFFLSAQTIFEAQVARLFPRLRPARCRPDVGASRPVSEARDRRPTATDGRRTARHECLSNCRAPPSGILSPDR